MDLTILYQQGLSLCDLSCHGASPDMYKLHDCFVALYSMLGGLILFLCRVLCKPCSSAAKRSSSNHSCGIS